MVMSWIFTGIALISILAAAINGNGANLSSAISRGAQAGVTLAISLAGSICLWSGIGKLLEAVGATRALSRLLQPALHILFPSTKKDPQLANHLSANICANVLGLGNAATPMGIQAAKRMALSAAKGVATDEMCRLIVLNTASIQLIPATVVAVRSNLGSVSPFDILPAVWITSFSSAGMGLLAAFMLGKLRKHD